jgi:tRNA uridine 5-carbamoylmethylation protein Kti12
MRTPAHLCKERNALRSHPVSDHSMAKIIESYEAPGNEYFEQNLIPVHIDQVHQVDFVADEIARNSVCIKLRKQIKTQTEQSQKHLVWVELAIFS